VIALRLKYFCGISKYLLQKVVVRPVKSDKLAMTTEVVAAYVSNNHVSASDVPALFTSIFSTLEGLSGEAIVLPTKSLAPAVPIKKSVTDDYIICLEDGLKFKSLRRHLMSKFGMTPEDYRAKWNLPADYPMVAPNYAKARSTLAKRTGLGKSRLGKAK